MSIKFGFILDCGIISGAIEAVTDKKQALSDLDYIQYCYWIKCWNDCDLSTEWRGEERK